MSVNPVSHSLAAAINSPGQPQQKAAAPPASQNDTVQLSAQAKAAAGDVDHDGDSH